MSRRFTILRKYIITIIVVIVTLTSALMLVNFHFFHTSADNIRDLYQDTIQSTLKQQLHDFGETWVQMLAEQLTNPLYHYDMEGIYSLLKSTRRHPNVQFIEILETDGRILHNGRKSISTFGEISNAPNLQSLLLSKQLQSHEHSKQLLISAPIVMGEEIIGFVRLSMSLADINHKISLINRHSLILENKNRQQALSLNLLVSSSIALFFLLIAMLAARRIVRPIQDLAELAKRIGSGITNQTIARISNDEIGDLSEAFNEMSVNLKKTTITRDYLNTIVCNLNDALIVTDNNKNIKLVNQTACEKLGYQDIHLIGQPLTSILRSVAGKNSNDYYLLSNEEELIDVKLNCSYIKNQAGNVTEIIYTAQDIREQKKQEAKRHKAERRIYQLAYYDALTGLPNRALFYDRLQQAISQLDRQNYKIALLYLDLNRFKIINDTKGHTYGDKLLNAVSKRLSCCLRESDTLARLGGDEFAILLQNIEQDISATTVAEKILACFKEPFLIDNQQFYSDTSIGISVAPEDTMDLEILIKNADTAMYHAKKTGSGSYCYFTEAMNTKMQEHVSIDEGLRHAISDMAGFYILYQAQMEVSSERIIGAEALLRWNYPNMDQITTEKFIAIAEENGSIRKIGYWVLEQAVGDWAKWASPNRNDFTIAVNISAKQLDDVEFAVKLKTILRKHGMPPKNLQLEFTENIFMEESCSKVLNTLNDIGVKLAIDDFGTGYSSLSYLKKFPIQALKIDQSFIHKITFDKDSETIANSILTLGHSLNLTIVAVGVEKEDQLRLLKKLHCDLVQGYYVGQPSNAEEMFAFLAIRDGNQYARLANKP